MRRIALIMAAMAMTATTAQAKPVRNIDAMRTIPGTSLQMVESEGRSFFMSPNGRYVIKGQLIDMWTGAKIEKVSDLENSAAKVDFQKMGLNLDDLMSLKYGTGPKEVVAFVAPGCPHCELTMKQMVSLTEEYTFRLVPLPFFGEESKNHVMQLACNEEYQEKAAEALILEDYSNLPVKSTSCDMERLQRSALTAQIMGIQSVPYLVAHDGRVLMGSPEQGLEKFLKGGR